MKFYIQMNTCNTGASLRSSEILHLRKFDTQRVKFFNPFKPN